MTFPRLKALPPAVHHLKAGPIRSEYFLDAIDNGRAKLATARAFFNRNRKDPKLEPISGDDLYLLNLREYARSLWSRPEIIISSSCLIKIKISINSNSDTNQVRNAATILSIFRRLINVKDKYKIYSIFYFNNSKDYHLHLEGLIVIPSDVFIDFIEGLLTQKLQFETDGYGALEIEPVTLTPQSLREETERICHYSRGSPAERASSVDAAIQAHAVAKIIGGLQVRGIAPLHRKNKCTKSGGAT